MENQDDLAGIQTRARTQRLVRVFERFIETLLDRAGHSQAQRVIRDGKYLDGGVIEQSPERFIEDELIEPTSEILGYDVRFRPKGFEGLDGRIPDFRMINLEVTNLGEVKTPGSVPDARKESVEYLDMAKERPIVGFATDGFVWILHTASKPGEKPTYTNHVTLHEFSRKLWIEQGYGKAEKRERRPLRYLAEDFATQFSKDRIEERVIGREF